MRVKIEIKNKNISVDISANSSFIVYDSILEFISKYKIPISRFDLLLALHDKPHENVTFYKNIEYTFVKNFELSLLYDVDTKINENEIEIILTECA